MSAFIISTATASLTHTRNSQSRSARSARSIKATATPAARTASTRREFLQVAMALTTATLLNTRKANAGEKVQLPNGARQFSQIISAQRQWSSLKEAFANGHEPDEAEWQNIRTYLRGVYAVSADMDYLTQRWEDTRKDVGLQTIKQFRKDVKALDKPAIGKDVVEFLKGHAQVEQLFITYLEQLKQDSVGDMPDEL